MAFVDVQSLVKRYPGQSGLFKKARPVQAVSGVSFSIAKGESLGLVGESGCGKSTLGRAILRLVEPDEGRVTIDGVDVTALAPGPLRAFRRNAQMIFQDPYASLNPRMCVGDIVAEPLVVHDLGTSAERTERVAALLAQVGLPKDSAQRKPHEFSGGQRQRIGIARALATDPKLVVADEPLSALDVSIQAQIVNLLTAEKAARGLSMLFISHDLKMVRHLCDRVLIMYLGRVVESGRPRALFATPLHPYTSALLSAVPVPDPTRRRLRLPLLGEPPSPADPPSGCHFHPRCARYVERGRPSVCVESAPTLIAATDDHLCACHFPSST
ncbi:MAG: oligopeptide/dipeptide ABC transporter ATP-binding protein [Polyangia bacterium]